VDVAAGTMTVNGAARKLPLAAMPAADDVTVEAVPLGGGKQVVHVRVPEKDADTKAYEAVLAPGGAEVFAGLTGFGDGDPGERTGKMVQVVPAGATSKVFVGDAREDVTLPGDAMTMLAPQEVEPGTMKLAPATLQKLSAARQQSATRVVADDVGAPSPAPLAKLLVATGATETRPRRGSPVTASSCCSPRRATFRSRGCRSSSPSRRACPEGPGRRPSTSSRTIAPSRSPCPATAG
jgi:hypothetical protein